MNEWDQAQAIVAAYPQKVMREAGCEWDLDSHGHPLLVIWQTTPDPESTVVMGLPLRSTVWGTSRVVELVRLSEVVRAARPSHAGEVIRERVEAAVRELRDPPPFYVERS